MNIRLKFLPVFALILLCLLTPVSTSAHPGRTAADGCHYCRTNCDKWGVAWNERHCHGGGVPVQQTEQVLPTKVVVVPTRIPTRIVTRVPTRIPTKKPTPSLKPTASPTNTPSPAPTHTNELTPIPSVQANLTPTSTTEVESITNTKNQGDLFTRFFSWVFRKK